MPHGYTIDIDDADLLEYSKTHNNGEKTRVKIERVGTKATGGYSYLVNVKDPNGSKRLGRRNTKKDAKRLASDWMSQNPKGVPGSGKGISGGSGGIPGMDGSGFF